MWTCKQCESTNDDASAICEVCGATWPVVSIAWENLNGALETKAILRWNGSNIRSAFAVCGERTFYLTTNKQKEIPIGDEQEDIVLYFCSSAGYRKYTYRLGNNDAYIYSFEADKTEVEWGDTIRLSWKTKNGECAIHGISESRLHGETSLSVRIWRNKTFTLNVIGESTTASKKLHITCRPPTLRKALRLLRERIWKKTKAPKGRHNSI